MLPRCRRHIRLRRHGWICCVGIHHRPLTAWDKQSFRLWRRRRTIHIHVPNQLLHRAPFFCRQLLLAFDVLRRNDDRLRLLCGKAEGRIPISCGKTCIYAVPTKACRLGCRFCHRRCRRGSHRFFLLRRYGCFIAIRSRGLLDRRILCRICHQSIGVK